MTQRITFYYSFQAYLLIKMHVHAESLFFFSFFKFCFMSTDTPVKFIEICWIVKTETQIFHKQTNI